MHARSPQFAQSANFRPFARILYLGEVDRRTSALLSLRHALSDQAGVGNSSRWWEVASAELARQRTLGSSDQALGITSARWYHRRFGAKNHRPQTAKLKFADRCNSRGHCSGSIPAIQEPTSDRRRSSLQVCQQSLSFCRHMIHKSNRYVARANSG